MCCFLATLNTAIIPLIITRYRDRQLNLQLPKQDLSTKYCSHLEQQHQVGKMIMFLPNLIILLG